MILAGGLDCDDERGWQRLANPVSGILRNTILVLLYGVIMLWGDLALWFQILVWPALIFAAFVSVRAVAPTEEDSWHARAIYGERIIACYGWNDATEPIRRRLWRVKGVETLTVIAMVLAIWFSWSLALTSAFAGFMICRLWLLRLTEQVCRKALEREE